MKTYFFILFGLLCCLACFAQVGSRQRNLPMIGIPKNSTLHLLSLENISYVDISSPLIKGDLPLKNILRLKLASDSVSVTDNGDAGTVTVVGESFIAQYRLYFLPSWETYGKPTIVEILPSECRPVATGTVISESQLKSHAIDMLSKKGPAVGTSEEYGIKISVKQLASIGEYIFIDLHILNQTNLPFDIDELSFSIDDKKITKATNVQSVGVRPIWQLHSRDNFKKSFRNIYVIRKLSYPENKVLNISLKEKQLSGRNLNLSLSYRDILRADTF